MRTMKAVCIYTYGGPEVLVYEDAPRPHPDDGEVLVRVHAAGINPVDWKIREGHLKDSCITRCRWCSVGMFPGWWRAWAPG